MLMNITERIDSIVEQYKKKIEEKNKRTKEREDLVALVYRWNLGLVRDIEKIILDYVFSSIEKNDEWINIMGKIGKMRVDVFYEDIYNKLLPLKKKMGYPPTKISRKDKKYIFNEVMLKYYRLACKNVVRYLKEDSRVSVNFYDDNLSVTIFTENIR